MDSPFPTLHCATLSISSRIPNKLFHKLELFFCEILGILQNTCHVPRLSWLFWFCVLLHLVSMVNPVRHQASCAEVLESCTTFLHLFQFAPDKLFCFACIWRVGLRWIWPPQCWKLASNQAQSWDFSLLSLLKLHPKLRRIVPHFKQKGESFSYFIGIKIFPLSYLKIFLWPKDLLD